MIRIIIEVKETCKKCGTKVCANYSLTRGAQGGTYAKIVEFFEPDNDDESSEEEKDEVPK